MGEYGVSNCLKLWLLFWKNWLIQFNNKVQLIAIIIIVLVICGFLITMRAFKESIHHEEKRFSKEKANLGEIYKVGFSPKNNIYEAIVQAAVENLNIRQVKGYANAEDLEESLRISERIAGIQFEDDTVNIKDYPKRLVFSLRFPRKLQDGKTWSTDQVYPETIPVKKLEELAYIEEGFVFLQNALVMAYLKQASKQDQIPAIAIQRYPYAKYTENKFLNDVSSIIVIFLSWCFLYPGITVINYIGRERESQLKEVMNIVGIYNWLHWLAWFLKSLIIFFIISALFVILLGFKIGTNGPVFQYINPMLLLLIFLTYSIALICCCFMMAMFFKKASSASVTFAILFLVTSVFPRTMITNLASKLFLSILSNIGFAYMIETSIAFEQREEVTHINKDKSMIDNLRIIYVVCIMFFSAILFMLVCFYVEKLNPGEYGVPYKWYFPIQRSFWCKSRKSEKEENGNRAKGGDEGDKEAGVQIQHLHKKFGNFVAVHDLSFNMYVNEITVLLGHNGAGKTTTIAMLTGLIPPTSGTAIVNGYNIRTHLSGARKSLGICPQQDIIFRDLTVKQHIVFFSRLKGIHKKAELKVEIEKYLDILELKKKKNTLAKNLSGGMKRKLSLCCALCGKAKTVFCDEPTSGVDPSARRRLWQLLQSEKQGRTILLTTHFMDEADVLGDRIVVMAGGRLAANGTPFELKKNVGSGYRLICEKREDCKTSKVTAFVTRHISGVKIESSDDKEVVYLLSEKNAKYFPALLEELEEELNDLKLNGYSITAGSIEDVFMRLGAQHTRPEKEDQADEEKGRQNLVEEVNIEERKWCNRFLLRLEGILLKKLLTIRRNWFSFLLQLLLPALFVFIMCYSGKAFKEKGGNQPLPIDLSKYGKAVVVLESPKDAPADSNVAKLAKAFQDYAKSSGDATIKTTGGESFENFIISESKGNQENVDRNYLVGVTFKNEEATAWINTQLKHTAPLTLNCIHNAMARVFVDPNAEVLITNVPSPEIEGVRKEIEMEEVATHLFMALIYSFIAAAYVFLPTRERVNGTKLQQFLSGINFPTYWLTIYIWDLLIIMLTSLLIIIALVILKMPHLSTAAEVMRFFLLLMIFGFGILPIVYAFSFLSKDPAGMFAILIVIFGLFSITAPIIVLGLAPNLKSMTSIDIMYIFYLMPIISLYSAFMDLEENYRLRKMCAQMDILFGGTACPKSIICCELKDYFSVENPGIGLPVLYMIIVGIVFMALILLAESNIVAGILGSIRSGPRKKRSTDDDDVLKEIERVEKMKKKDRNVLPLVVDRITKQFCGKRVVNEISFCVLPNECFGLLGVNGAGKTTTFRMLTGHTSISSGQAYVKGKPMRTCCWKPFVHIAYCPQFDALFEDMTGRNNLRIFSLLNGVKRKLIPGLSEKLARDLDFIQHIDKPVKKFSGGNKRKLSTAISILGNPTIIFLDEPSSGMDPGARRNLWKVIKQIVGAGKPVVLTSHSMEECEALCTRVAIMVAGKFKCIGRVSSLRSKFSQGLILKIKLSKKENKQKLKDFVKAEFSTSEVYEEYENLITFYIPVRREEYGKLFGVMESNKERFKIEDYSISHTSLEEIFLHFAKNSKKTN